MQRLDSFCRGSRSLASAALASAALATAALATAALATAALATVALATAALATAALATAALATAALATTLRYGFFAMQNRLWPTGKDSQRRNQRSLDITAVNMRFSSDGICTLVLL